MKKKILWFLFIVTIILLLIISYNFIVHIKIFNDHRKYFDLPKEQQTIKQWMSLNYIERTYWIDFEKMFWNEIWVFSKNDTLLDYCNEYNIDCKELIITLD